MENNNSVNEIQAVQACLDDAVAFRDMMLELQSLPTHTSNLISPGYLSESAMFIVESYECLKKVTPDIANICDPTLVNELRIMRHRTKLLESQKDIKKVINILSEIEIEQVKQYRGAYTGFFAPILDLMRSDIGLTKCNKHIITTTHSTMYFLSLDVINNPKHLIDLSTKIGEYVETLV
ncbi:hypothetical protein [Psychrobacter sp. FDAARGOS_221]|uniref:hypothetical protein n=1 Tax=Psychrobacter sp. FDAARGOS_221 TaxID=1975705 RepID=UPI000BB58EB6|nr:hypothetical protein [Psychrobacter sp. FDAARGOS_221]PNK59803.1 hypothetical protein A6J60_002180 [Psychrobacter sp. FDAARGOS_221]